MDRSELAAASYATSHLVGAFQLRSGRTTSEYFDKYRFESDPILLRAIAAQAADRIPPEAEVLAGSELGGLPVVFVRKAAKPYGTRQLAEGAEVAGQRVLVVEDVITSGAPLASSVADLRERGAVIDDALCVVDRGEGGAELLSTHGLRMHALFTAEDLKAGDPQRADAFRDFSRSRTPTTR